MYNLLHIKTLAEKKKVTLKEIILNVGMSEAGFHKSIKNGNMGIAYLDKIAEYLDVSISELVYDSYCLNDPLPPKPNNNYLVSEPISPYNKITPDENLYKELYNLQKEITEVLVENERLKNGAAVGKTAQTG